MEESAALTDAASDQLLHAGVAIYELIILNL